MDKAKILVVEDEGIVAQDLKNTLRGMGYAIAAVVSFGEEAVKKAVETKPDLVLMDIRLKGTMDGVEAADQIRTRLDIPVVYLTAYADDQTLRRAKITEPFGYLLKPFQEKELSSTIELALYMHAIGRRLRESEERHRFLVENSTDIFGTIDSHRKISYVAPSVERILGHKPEIYIGKDALWPVHPDDLPFTRETLDQLIQNPGTTRSIEHRLKGHDGSWRVFQTIGRNILDDSGHSVVIVNSRDITERKMAEDALKESEERYRSILDNIEEGYFEVDIAGNFTFLNDSLCRGLGYSKEEMVGMNNRQYMSKEIAKKVYQVFNRVYTTGEPCKADDWEIIRKDGTKRVHESSLSLMRNDNGEPIGFRGIARDVTEKRDVEETLRKSEEEAKRLAQENAIVAKIGRIISSTFSIEEVYKLFADEVKKLLSFDRIVINMIHAENKSLVNPYVEGIPVPGKERGGIYPIGGTFTEAVIRAKKGLKIEFEDEYQVREKFPGFLPEFSVGLRSFLSVPLISGDMVIGAFHLQSRKYKAYSEGDLRLAEGVAIQIAGAIANAQLFLECRGAEGQLRRSEEHFRLLIENSSDIIITIDENKNISYASPSAKRMLEYNPEDYMGKDIFQLVHPDDLAFISEALVEILQNPGTTKFIEHRVRHKDGSWRIFQTITHSILEDSGKAIVIANLRDITKRKQMEETLVKSERKYRELVENANSIILRVDKEGNVIFFNEFAQKFFGYTEAEILGRNAVGTILPEKESTGRDLRSLVEDMVIHPEQYANNINENIKSNGEKVWIAWTNKLDRDEKGNVTGILCIGNDTTEGKRVEEALKRAKEFNENVLNSMKEALAIIDVQDFKIVDLNRTFLDWLGMKKEQVIGKRCYAVTHNLSEPCNFSSHPCPLLHTLKTGGPAVVEHVHSFGNREKMHVEVTSSPIKNEKGEVIQVVYMERDVTEQKTLQSQLAQAQKLEAIGSLAAGIAHEINTPTQYVGDNTRFFKDAFSDLNRLLGKYEELWQKVKAGGPTDGAVREVAAMTEEIDLAYLTDEIPKAIQQTLEGVERVRNIVQAMKEFSHPGTKEKTFINLNKAIQNTITVARNEWKYVAEMVTDFDPSLPLVSCLPGELNQVILNMIINAAHAIADVVGDGSKGKGTITLGTCHDGNWAEIRVSDTGTGIPEDIRSRIFDPFFTTKKVGKGTGQGLTISHSVIVDKHGGTIYFDTEMGKGTTFIIRLPIENGGRS